MFSDTEIPKFLYGTHYSSLGFVLYYLIRLQPFCNLALKLQGGHFDHAERLFGSMQETWDGCLNGTSDVKELV